MANIRLALITLSLAAISIAQAANVVVYPGQPNGWGFADDNGNGGTGGFQVGPGAPPAGTGSAYFNLTASNQGIVLGTFAFAGTPLSQLTTLKYWTYRTSPLLGVTAPSLQFNVDFTGTDAFQGRLVFEPYQTPGNTVLAGTWQEWNALAGRWWATRAPYNSQFGQSSPMTLPQILALYPNARIKLTDGFLGFKAGSGWTSFDGNVDMFTLGVNGNNTTFDFEANAPDTDGDGVGDDVDHCINSDMRPFVDAGNGPTSIPNIMDDNGCFLQDDINEMADNAQNHGQYVSAVTKWSKALADAGVITNKQRAELVSAAGRSNVGK